LIAQHKSGTAMSEQAALYMEQSTLNGFPWISPVIDAAWSTYGLALNASMMRSPLPACFVHMARNPLEMVVSNYRYHVAAEEPEWTQDYKFSDTLDRDGCTLMFLDSRMSTMCSHPKYGLQPYWLMQWLTGIAKVYHASYSGNLSAWLPDVRANESWSEYLQRVDTDAGLIANVIWTPTTTMPALKTSHDFMESQPCSLNVCFNEWYDDCDAVWNRVLTTWQIEEPEYGSMLEAAKASCPGGNPLTRLATFVHSSAAGTKVAGVKTEEAWRMVKRLRELDLLLFNGSLAALEKHIACPLSGHYKEM